MSRGAMTITDITIDGASRDQLKAVSRVFVLGLRCPWWLRTDLYREQVREALRAKWREEQGGAK